MGEVYRATDSKLGRDVALKILPEAFTRDRERLARFEREARVLAQLNHPNIAAIYGLEESGETPALVLEYVEGMTLQERIKGGTIPVEEVLSIALEMAEALEAAHESGIIHRDLKPANVKVTPEGRVKILDFGLAKAMEGGALRQEPPLSHSPTLGLASTRAGVILGTAAYMSPEQARGKEVDRRADNWAFGCLLYEMLSGRAAFGGETLSDTLASVIRGEPEWERLPQNTPPSLRRIMRRSLKKDPRARLRDIGDARLEMEEVEEPQETTPPATRGPRGHSLLYLAAGLLLGAMASGAFFALGPSEPVRSARLVLPLEPSEGLDLGIGYVQRAFAFSPDGLHVVFVGRQGPSRRLMLRALDGARASPLPGTEDASSPFFSPDGQWVAFHASQKLKKVSIKGGMPITICEVPGRNSEGSWGSDDTIVFSSGTRFGSQLWQVAAGGGSPAPIARPRPNQLYYRPAILPGARAVLFSTISLDKVGAPTVEVLRLADGEIQTLLEGGTSPAFARSGYLFYSSGSRLLAVPFDPVRLQLQGAPLTVLEDLFSDPTFGSSFYSLANNGTLLFLSRGQVSNDMETLQWMGASGTLQALGGKSLPYADPRLSPEGKRVALDIVPDGADVWIRDLVRGTLSRMTVNPGEDETPVWSPDGRVLAFAAQRTGARGEGSKRFLMQRAADGSGGEEVLWTAPAHFHVSSWSADGQNILLDILNPESGWDIWVVTLGETTEARPLLASRFAELHARLSPDDRWLAYTSDQSGRMEVYLQAFPKLGARFQVSLDGGMQPVWSRDGRRLFFRREDKLFAVDVSRRNPLTIGQPKFLREVRFGFAKGPEHFGYDVAADGRFLISHSSEGRFPHQLTLILNALRGIQRSGAR